MEGWAGGCGQGRAQLALRNPGLLPPPAAPTHREVLRQKQRLHRRPVCRLQGGVVEAHACRQALAQLPVLQARCRRRQALVLCRVANERGGPSARGCPRRLAGQMRRRLAGAAPAAGAREWVGTREGQAGAHQEAAPCTPPCAEPCTCAACRPPTWSRRPGQACPQRSQTPPDRCGRSAGAQIESLRGRRARARQGGRRGAAGGAKPSPLRALHRPHPRRLPHLSWAGCSHAPPCAA